MAEIDFMSGLHKSTHRDYLGRVNDPVFPKPKAAELAKKFDFDTGMVTDVYVMAAINIWKVDGKK